MGEPEDQVGSVVLRRPDGRQLTVINVNRTSVETTLGVDLIYYNHAFQSFVMVQYKDMESNEDDDGEKTAVYRPNADRAYQKELARMNGYLSRARGRSLPIREGYRLSRNPFLFKLCPRIIFDPLSASPIKSMYLPLDYWKLLLASSEVQGPRGGVHITYANAGRYLDKQPLRRVGRGWMDRLIDRRRAGSGDADPIGAPREAVRHIRGDVEDLD